ncbi:MAG: PAS domain-containing protein [Verrucomicrobiales bacterium]|nr:PAS domain-containing protein [Verrucomicrobiales bacterium]
MGATNQFMASVAATVPGALFAFQVRPDGAWCFPYASPKLEEVVGVSPEVAQRDVNAAFARVHEADLPRLLETIRVAVAGTAPWEAMFRVNHPRKGLVWIEGRSEPVSADEGGRVWHGFMFDVTSRRSSEQRRATEHAVTRVLAQGRMLSEVAGEVLHAICEAEGWALGGIWVADDSGQTLRCAGTWAAPAYAESEVLAQTRDLAVGLGEGLPGRVWATGDALILPDIAGNAGYLRARTAAAAGLRSAAGFPIRDRGRVIGVLDCLSAHPIEPSRELRETFLVVGSLLGQFIARTAAQEELHRFVALNPSVLYALRITPTKLRFFWVSENLEAMTGYSPAEAAHGNWWLDHLHPEDRERVLAANPKPYTMEHQVLEFRFRRRDGKYLWLRDEKRLLRDSHGQPSVVIGAWSDVTERVQLEAQLRQAQKMEAIGLLSGGIAHDFNNLLGAILGNARLATMDLDPAHPAAECLEEILRAGQRAASLVRQILAFARQDRRERHPVDLWHLVEESVRLLRPSLSPGVELRIALVGERPRLTADETQMQQVVLNLITNAVQALRGAPGVIRVEMAAVDLEGEEASVHPDLRPGRFVRLRVSDTGEGMDESTLERVFEPFFTTKPQGQGTGLGLSVVHGIVKAHQGAILVSSRLRVGSTFDVYLPETVSESPAGGVGKGIEFGRPDADPRGRG